MRTSRCVTCVEVLAALTITMARAAAAQDSVSTRIGKRPRLPRGYEIALARSAAPPSVSASASVMVLTDSGYIVVERGASGVVCMVNRSWLHSVEPHCYDAEAARTVMPIEQRRFALREQGTPESLIDQDIASGIAKGRFVLPTRPAMSYMMSSAQILYDDHGHRVGPWRPHVMIYFPYLTSASVGFGAAPDMSVGVVSDAGSAESNLTLIAPGFVPGPKKPL